MTEKKKRTNDEAHRIDAGLDGRGRRNDLVARGGGSRDAGVLRDADEAPRRIWVVALRNENMPTPHSGASHRQPPGHGWVDRRVGKWKRKRTTAATQTREERNLSNLGTTRRLAPMDAHLSNDHATLRLRAAAWRSSTHHGRHERRSKQQTRGGCSFSRRLVNTRAFPLFCIKSDAHTATHTVYKYSSKITGGVGQLVRDETLNVHF